MATNSNHQTATPGSTSQTNAKGKDDNFHQILTCGICLSRMTLPCCLPCAHPFCRQCLIEYARNHIRHGISLNNSLLCPFCKYQLNFSSLEHFETMLIVNPVLNQLCEALDAQPTSTSGVLMARCHSCSSIKPLKVCKHCSFTLCETCRQNHLLEVHRESSLRLKNLEYHWNIVLAKHEQLDRLNDQFERFRGEIQSFSQRLIQEIETQRDRALQRLAREQEDNEASFWALNGLTNKENLDSLKSLVETGKRKLAASNITDKELIELFESLSTIPVMDESKIGSIEYRNLLLEFDEKILRKKLIDLRHDEPKIYSMDDESFLGDELND